MEDHPHIPQNEFKLNLGTTIFGSFPELTMNGS